ncbi:MAG: phosphatidylglycerophosphatase A [Candidatus Latescibacteria bacterium]|nr:phosphatidylglycerophosphatase A [Candidatus Latescibacterota bacterium]
MGILKKSVTAEHERTGGGLGDYIARFISSGMGVGYVPVAQGTVGSLWGPVLFLIAPQGCFKWIWFSVPVLILIGVWASYRSEIYWGHDPGRVVIDEVAGVLITLVFITPSVHVLIAGFILFRIFDIFKPPPVRFFEKLPGGWGVMMDDVAAGIYAHIVLRVMINFFPGMI